MSDPIFYSYVGSDFPQGELDKDEKVFPTTHLGHHIGPAPTNQELGLEKPSKVDAVDKDKSESEQE